jgi:hypothetical protein
MKKEVKVNKKRLFWWKGKCFHKRGEFGAGKIDDFAFLG